MKEKITYQDASRLGDSDVISEAQLIEWGGLKPDTLKVMRNDGRLAYTYLDQNHRFYFVVDILDLLKRNRRSKK
jgi:hypothetical protein